jgi:hypothetical protein
MAQLIQSSCVWRISITFEVDQEIFSSVICAVQVFGINSLSPSVVLYSAFTDKVERNCQFPAPGWKCMTRRQGLQGSPDQVSLHKNNKINLPILQQSLPDAGN